jgi:two-component system NtrC family sensor kinase
LDNELFVFSASPLDDGRMFIVGYSLDRNDNMVSRIQNEIAIDKEAVSSVTIFMGTTRVATTMGEGLIGTAVDSVAGNMVLRYGQYHVGLTKILEENYYSAYCPLRDHSGRVVGMLEIGTPERLHADVRRRTNTLFTSLIVGGMTFGFIMTYVFSSFLMKPFSILTMGVERVAEGDLNYKVQIKTADELGRLAKSFNMMVRAVKERDLRLREMTEKKLSSVEKQVSIGRLAAGIAHEINNPLTAVLTLSRLMLKHMDKNDPRAEDLGMIVEETGRCRDIVRSLLDFARENKPQKEVVDINGVLRDTLILAGKYDAMTDTLIDLKLSSSPLATAVDTGQMQQVFTNLLLNAAEAMEGGKGRITISTGEDSSGGFISIAFADNGKGISSEQLETVFEPFYTSKEKGTGLGLSVSLGIVRSHKGTIEIQSEPGVGTTVTVILPKNEDDRNVI